MVIIPPGAVAAALFGASIIAAAAGADAGEGQRPLFLAARLGGARVNAGLFLARGMAYVLSTDSIRIEHPFYDQVSDLVYIFPDRGRFTFAAGAFLVMLIVGIFLAHFTRFGRNVYALGGNSDAALLLGVPVGQTTILVYAMSSFLATLAGIVLSLSKHSGDSTIAVGLELDVIAAVVIGGTLLTGGVGYVIGTFIAVMTLGTIQTYLTLDGSLTPWWIKIVIGILLFAFVGLQKLLSSRQGILALGRRTASTVS